MKKYFAPILLALLLGAGLWGLVSDSVQKHEVANDPMIAEQVYAKSDGETLTADNIMAATNVEREKVNLHPLVTNKHLNNSACAKLDDMVKDNYWAHDNPNGTTPWKFFKDAEYEYSSAGENLAYGQMSTPEVITAWLNSPKHKDNMLKDSWMEQGVCVKHVNFIGKSVFLMVHHFGVR